MENLLEEEIIGSLLKDSTYFSSCIHHIEGKHFEEPGMEALFNHIKDHYITYHNTPTLKELILSFKDSPVQIKEQIRPSIKLVQKAQLDQDVQRDMLLDLTEKFIKSAIFRDAIITGADALGSHSEEKMNESYAIAEQAIKVSLTSDFGVDLTEIDKVYDEFQDKPGYKVNIKSWDDMMGSGVTTKTLNAFAAASGIGKSAAMVSFAVEYIKQGLDVVIVSLEMSEAEFFKRIYSNIFDISISEITRIDKQVLKTKLNQMTLGKLIIKEFPTGSLTPLGLESFLDKLNNERGIHRPIVFVDYLGLMDSDKVKNRDNSYSFYGSIAEELRAVAQKKDITMWTALQLNRSAISNLEASQAELSESMKIMMILDFMVILAQTPDLKEKSEMKINIVKNRYSGKTWSFQIGYDYHHFRFDDRFYMGGENISREELLDPISGQISGMNTISGMMST